jgi:hypothetical protein
MATDTHWLARIAPVSPKGVTSLLELPLGLDVWQREEGALIVAARETQLRELERRRLATVERIETLDEHVDRLRRMAQHACDNENRGKG